MKPIKTPLLSTDDHPSVQIGREHKTISAPDPSEGDEYHELGSYDRSQISVKTPRAIRANMSALHTAAQTTLQPIKLNPSPAKFWIAFMSGIWFICASAQGYLVYLSSGMQKMSCVTPSGDKYFIGTDHLYISWILLVVMALSALMCSPYCGCVRCCRDCTRDAPLHVLVQTTRGMTIVDV